MGRLVKEQEDTSKAHPPLRSLNRSLRGVFFLILVKYINCMLTNLPTWLSRAIDFQFHLLVLLTPLVFFPHSYELFEFNKMILVYTLTITIVSTWVIRMLILGRLSVPKTPFDLPILILLVSRTLSTIFSIDSHTSFWGYYSRFNEGLYSSLAYILLFYAFVAHFNKKPKIFSLLFSLFISTLLVSLWGLPGHFGTDVSCLLINKRLGVDCWHEEFNPMNRIYSTLGQPNWFAAFIVTGIFLGVSYLILNSQIGKKFLFSLSTILVYLAFTFAYSRGATVGLLSGLAAFLLGILLIWKVNKSILGLIKNSVPYLAVILISFVTINIIFGSALSKRPVSIKKPAGTQLETGGTESGQIRLVVWRGALEVFKHYPILGSGLETFAYSYYFYRPREHNLTSEWDFIYNKAHNEYLNILATTGLVGLGALGYFLLTFFRQILTLSKRLSSQKELLIIISLSSLYISILVQNIFGFSVVILSLLIFLIPALIISLKRAEEQKFDFHSLNLPLNSLNPGLFQVAAILGVFSLTTFTLRILFSFWVADISFAQANGYLEADKPDRAVTQYRRALSLRNEPLYHSQLSIALSHRAVNEKENLTLRDEAKSEGLLALKISSKNLSLYKNLYRAYTKLATLDDRYHKEAFELMQKAKEVAPTDPKIAYNLAKSFEKLPTSQTDHKINLYQEAVDLKPDWPEPRLSLAQIYKDLNQKDKAEEEYKKILQYFPEAEDIKEKIRKLQET